MVKCTDFEADSSYFDMKNQQQKVGIIRWVAGILRIVFAAFISIFALDVLSEGYHFKDIVITLFMYFIPIFLIFLMLIFAWHRDWTRAIGYLILGIYYLASAWGEIYWTGIALIAGTIFILAILYFMVSAAVSVQVLKSLVCIVTMRDHITCYEHFALHH